MTRIPFDFPQRARRALAQYGFSADFPAAVCDSLRTLQPRIPADARDLRSLAWSSIDNASSRDLDQIEVSEKMPDGSTRLLIGIADVDSLVAKGSPLDQQAAVNTTSIYTGGATFPMLPEELSTDRTSLREGEERLAVVIELVVSPGGALVSSDAFAARVVNKAQLNYETMGPWLEDRGPMPEKIARVPGLESQLRWQAEVSDQLGKFRQTQGALAFSSREPVPVVVQGEIESLHLEAPNRSRNMIQNFMVEANMAAAMRLRQRGIPALRRVVPKPERWDRIREIAAQHGQTLPLEPISRALADFMAGEKARDPEKFPELSLSIVKLLGPGEYVVDVPGGEHVEHFGLAVADYAHATAPNRRYADLVTQRLLKSPTPAYSAEELAGIAAHCNERAAAARKVERLMRKVAAAVVLAPRTGEVFPATVTGAKSSGVFARLQTVPAEGRVVRGEAGLDVGDRVRLRLLSADPESGFIDFEAVR